jgi:hypothetical protein
LKSKGQSTLDKREASFIEVQSNFRDIGVNVVRLNDSKSERYLGLELTGINRVWQLDVDCDDKSVASLPRVVLRNRDALRAHVSYEGVVCVSDAQGLSLDPERRSEIVAYTVRAAFQLLEKWDSNVTGNLTEFFNELESYWLSLPNTVNARAAISVDEQDRLIDSYCRTGSAQQYFFSERDEEPPRYFDVKGLSMQRAAYFHLPDVINPPAYPSKLGTIYLKELQKKLSTAQLEIWQKLVRPFTGRNPPRKVAMILSFPREAGGLSLVGISFCTKDGRVDDKAAVLPLVVKRSDFSYVRERGGASLDLANKHVVVIGCGAVGSVLADTSAAVGVGKLTLVDNDVYSDENIFRHILEPVYVGLPKVLGLEFYLQSRYPGVTVKGHNIRGQDWLNQMDLNDIDAIVFAIGLPTLERSFQKVLRKKNKNIPLIFTWLEPLDLGGHSVCVWTMEEGCLDCLYRDDEGFPSLCSRVSFLEPNQIVSKNLTGCASVFVPYSALQSRRTALIATEQVLSALSNQNRKPAYRFWAGPGEIARTQGLRTTYWWQKAKTLSESDATTRLFERPCGYCRVSK